MARPLPLPVWDRQRGIEEWMEDHQAHYESEPQRSLTQWSSPSRSMVRPPPDASVVGPSTSNGASATRARSATSSQPRRKSPAIVMRV
jgi:hypothetical protein